jgi:hypothetical protein
MRIVMMTSLVALMSCAAPAFAGVSGSEGGGVAAKPSAALPAPDGDTAPEMTEAQQAGYVAAEPAVAEPAPKTPVASMPASTLPGADATATLAAQSAPTPEPVDANPVPHTLNAQYADIRDHGMAERAARAEPAAEPSASPQSESARVAPQLVASAVAFRAYMQKSAALDARFTGASMVKASLERAEAYKIQQLSSGGVAYAAMVALQNEGFVQGVAKLKAFPQSRDAVFAELVSAPDNVMQIEGANEAAGSARAALAGLGRSLVKQGRAVKKAAYTVQADAWSKKAAEGQEHRLSDAKLISQTEVEPSRDDTKLMMTSLVDYRTHGQSAGGEVGGAPSVVVAKGLALAALMVLGEADEAHLSRLSPLLADAKNADCLNMAKLNLFQCLSVAGPEYEDVFCLGEHAMTDTGQCVVAASGSPIVAAEPVAPRPRLIQALDDSAASEDVQVPVAFGGRKAADVADNALSNAPAR